MGGKGMRQLVTIQRIHDIKPIEGRDRVEQATILGWKVIVGKGIFHEDELVCFAEIDSLFPATEKWEELAKFKYRIKLFKVNTPDGPIYGQGYCMPLTVLEDCDDRYPKYYEEGEEVTELLGVTKYEPPVEFSVGDTAGSFPCHYIPETDEIRVASKPEVLEELRGLPYVIRQKCDGSSMTSLFDPAEQTMMVCSRSLAKKRPVEGNTPCAFWKAALKYKLEELFQTFPEYGIQMELVGEKIQKNRMGIVGHEVRVFNIAHLPSRKYVDDDEFERLMGEFQKISPNLTACKVIERGDNFQHTLESLQAISIHKYDSGKQAEGIVIRPQKEMYSRVLGGRLSFKQINPEFLAEGGN
jgi:RNA ligase (TIGR02306 family)